MEIIERCINRTIKNSSEKHYMMSVKTLHFNFQKYVNLVFNQKINNKVNDNKDNVSVWTSSQRHQQLHWKQIQGTIFMRFCKQRFTRTFKNSNATNANLSENYHSSYVTGCTTNLTFIRCSLSRCSSNCKPVKIFRVVWRRI